MELQSDCAREEGHRECGGQGRKGLPRLVCLAKPALLLFRLSRLERWIFESMLCGDPNPKPYTLIHCTHPITPHPSPLTPLHSTGVHRKTLALNPTPLHSPLTPHPLGVLRKTFPFALSTITTKPLL